MNLNDVDRTKYYIDRLETATDIFVRIKDDLENYTIKEVENIFKDLRIRNECERFRAAYKGIEPWIEL